MVGVPVVREITDVEYRARRAEITIREREVQRARVLCSFITGGDVLRDVYPRRRTSRGRA